MYAGTEDPWDLAGRWYEQRKYALTLGALPHRRFRRAFEPGCSVGVLTGLLAERCEEVLAADRVASAVDAARARNRDLPHVAFRHLVLPQDWPKGSFDLIVLSELLYYFDDATLRTVLDRAAHSLAPGGTLLTVHWDHPVPDHVRTGRELDPFLDAAKGLSPQLRLDDPDFVLRTFRRALADGSAAPSTAAAEGLV
ncbi:class I SAM-dependent methyltransferase [Streptomyces sp. NPDC007088]|uniref:class I SAM-dependent methyltransferase n=1 Tax=Streptomyces sp. NPDC007088 TaxID=3364773 RepID=UPI00368090BF